MDFEELYRATYPRVLAYARSMASHVDADDAVAETYAIAWRRQRDIPRSAELGWLIGYSPYHRVAEGTAYPAVLFTVFDSDTRVDPLHARKMCAALQAATSSDRPVLFRRERHAGHGARSARAHLSAIRAEHTMPLRAASAAGATAASRPKQRFKPRATLYSPPPSQTSNERVV